MFKLTTISAILFTTTVFNAFLFFISWRRKRGQVGLYFALAMISLTLWTLASALDYAAVLIPLKVLFAKIEYIFSRGSLTFILLFTIHYAGHEKWLRSKWLSALIWLVPASSALLALTNEWHKWVWSGFEPSVYGNNVLVYEHGPVYLWVVISSYAIVLLATLNLWSASRKSGGLIKRQARLLLVALFIPVFGGSLYHVSLKGLEGIDWSSLLFSLSGLLILIALYSTKLLNLVPVARNMIVEQMKDPVIVLTDSDQVIDFNAAAKTFGLSPTFVGKSITTLFGNCNKVKSLLDRLAAGKSNVHEVCDINGTIYHIQISKITGSQGEVIGKLLIFRDITSQKLAEAKLSEAQELLIQQQRDLAKVEERQRMARDLHDSVNQSIHSMVLFSETLQATLSKKDYNRADQIIDRLQESARQSLKETRLLLYQLQSENSDLKIDCIPDLKKRLSMVEQRAGVEVNFIHEGSLDNYPQEVNENLFWIAIEALNNALKHAQARKVDVRLQALGYCVTLEVQDNGIGFTPDKTSSGGIGIHNLQERTDIIGGDIQIDSQPGQGTTVRVEVNLKPVREVHE